MRVLYAYALAVLQFSQLEFHPHSFFCGNFKVSGIGKFDLQVSMHFDAQYKLMNYNYPFLIRNVALRLFRIVS